MRTHSAVAGDSDSRTLSHRARVAFSALVVLVGAALLAPPAHARMGRGPVFLDDPTVSWRGVWEARLDAVYASGVRFENADLRLVRVPLRLSYGWRDRNEVAIEVPYLQQDSERTTLDRAGVSDVTVEFKYQMSGDDRDGSASATSLYFGSGPANEIGSDGFLFGIRYRLARRLLRGQGNAEIGYTHFGDRPDGRFNYGLSYTDPLGRSGARWSIEMVGNAGLNPRLDGDLSILAGIAYPAGRTLEVHAAAGLGVSGDAAPSGGIIKAGVVQTFGRSAEEHHLARTVRWEPPQAPSAAEWIVRGDRALAAAEYEAAAGHYQEALAADPREASAWNNLGVARYAQGRIRDAREAFEKALANGKEEADVYFNLGLSEYRLGDLPAARRNFMRALERDPAHPLARENLRALEAPSR